MRSEGLLGVVGSQGRGRRRRRRSPGEVRFDRQRSTSLPLCCLPAPKRPRLAEVNDAGALRAERQGLVKRLSNLSSPTDSGSSALFERGIVQNRKSWARPRIGTEIQPSSGHKGTRRRNKRCRGGEGWTRDPGSCLVHGPAQDGRHCAGDAGCGLCGVIVSEGSNSG